MTDLKLECARLRELGRSRPTEASRRTATDALRSKFESIQVEGGKLLGRWGGRGAVASLREWLLRSCQKPKSHAVRAQAAKALAQCLGPEDAEWILDLYFSRPKSADAYLLLPLIEALPWKTWLSRVSSEAKSRSVIRRRAAALAVARGSFPSRRELLQQLRLDTDRDIQSLAAWHLSHEHAEQPGR
jgi:HEAT repeat protein